MRRQTVPGRVACVGGIVRDDAGRLLLIRRGQEPDKGRWSLPGGRVEAGETDEQATVREVLAETGLEVEVVGGPVGAVLLPGMRDGAVADVVDFVCRPAPGSDATHPRAGDDAADAGWFTVEEVRRLDCSPGLVDTLDAWGLLSVSP